jgi:tripartite-type tricarboxylate transporter receptor subunit TctC
VSNTLITISVPASLNIASLERLMTLTREQPGKLNWAGVTGALDFLFAGFLKSAGLSMTKVPYRNPVEAANDLAEGGVRFTSRRWPSCGHTSSPARSSRWR